MEVSVDWLDTKYVNIVGGRLDRFKRVQKNYNFRCPLCGDSKKSKSKARGWILDRPKGARFYCHNCGASLSLSNFLKRVDATLYYDYIKDRYVEREEEGTKEPETDFSTKRPTFEIKLKRVSQLRQDHPVKRYVESRRIPPELHYLIYYAPRFKEWVNSLVPGKMRGEDEPRLVLPMFDEEGRFFGFQGRSFRRDADDKYVTILLDERKPKLYGLDRVDFSKTVYVVEGPIDSLFVPNCLASCGGRLDTNVGEDAVIVYDLEYRNKETVKKIERAIEDGYKVCLWPDEMTAYGKDINDFVKNGINVVDIIDKNTYRGLMATLRLNELKKC